MLSRFAVSGSVLRCTKCQVSSLIFSVLKMNGNLLLKVQGRALLTTKPSPNEGGGLKGILGRFFARRQVPLKTPFLLLHIYLQMTLAMPISPAIGRTEPIAASRAVSCWMFYSKLKSHVIVLIGCLMCWLLNVWLQIFKLKTIRLAGGWQAVLACVWVLSFWEESPGKLVD